MKSNEVDWFLDGLHDGLNCHLSVQVRRMVGGFEVNLLEKDIFCVWHYLQATVMCITLSKQCPYIQSLIFFVFCLFLI